VGFIIESENGWRWMEITVLHRQRCRPGKKPEIHLFIDILSVH